jgi:hypothetical protein
MQQAGSGLGSGVAAALGIGTGSTGGFPTIPVGNGSLANPSVTVNGQACTLGSSCTVPSAAAITNASGSARTTTTSGSGCVASNTTITLSSAIDFTDGQGISLENCGATFTGSPPTGLAVASTGGSSYQGPAGSTTYAYKAACLDNNGGVGVATASATTMFGNATLGLITQAPTPLYAYNEVTWTKGAGCVGTAIWRSTSGGAYALIGVFDSAPASGFGQGGHEIDDTGLPTATIPWVPATPPPTALNDRLVTTIASGQGTTSLVLNAPPSSSLAADSLVRHDDTAALTTYFGSTASVSIPLGTYNIEGITIPTNVVSFVGTGGQPIIQGWSTLTDTLQANTMPSGFTFNNVAVASYAAGNSIALEIDSTISATISNSKLTGTIGLWSNGNSAFKANNNLFVNDVHARVVEDSGLENAYVNNIVMPVIAPNQSVSIFS